MKSTFNICFYAKKDKQKANGAYPLFARITVDGVASRFNTKLDVLPSIWDGKMGKATGRTSEASRINRMLDDINASLNSCQFIACQSGVVFPVYGISVASPSVQSLFSGNPNKPFSVHVHIPYKIIR